MTDIKEANIFKSIDEQKKHWYYYTKISVIADNIRDFLQERPPRIPLQCLDIGAGSGIISLGLTERFPLIDWHWTAVDTSYCDEELAQIQFKYNKVRSIPNKQYDLIIAADVLEHVKDDSALTTVIYDRLAPNAIAVLTVPALNCLWSSHDDYLGHYRRYRLKQLTKLVQDCNMDTVASGYIFSALLPVAALARWQERFLISSHFKDKKSQMRVTSGFLNKFLISLMKAEALCKQKWPAQLGKVVGISAFVICKKLPA